MTNRARYFEMYILRPIFVVSFIFGVCFLFKGMWLWFGGCLLALFYLGIVGSGLHPMQSASDLAKGSLEGAQARIEAGLIPQEVEKVLVGYACTRIGILLGVTIGIILWGWFNWRWYFVILLAWVCAVVVGSLLKVGFKTLHDES